LLALIVKLKIKPGSSEEFERRFADLAELVRASEVGNIEVRLCRSQTDPTMFTAFEIYRDQAAIDAHEKMAYVAAHSPGLMALFDGVPKVETLDLID